MQNAADAPSPVPSPPLAGERVPEAGEGPPHRESSVARPVEIGGRSGPEPTRYGDWEKNGRCIDF
ncbi:MAG: DUF1674 domain-containing protein [Gammaproteobacteria bacterium]